MKNLIITISLVLCVNILNAQTLNKYHGGSGDGYSSSTATKATALPVILINFTAEIDHEIVTLKWSTSSEINSELFIIQRSQDGIKFENAGEVSAQGNSTKTVRYSFGEQLTDQTGTWYYKLLQKDMDQEVKSIGVKAVTITQPVSVPTISIYPNPANNNIVLINNTTDCLDITTIVIFANDGKIYYCGTYNCSGIDVANYPDGIYYLTSFGKRIESLKFVVKH